MKNSLINLATTISLMVTSQIVMSQAVTSTPVTESAKSTADMANGEVRKLDRENKKITLKHGAIKNLDMPGMTMVFQVKESALLDNLKAGDKVKFKAEQSGNAIVVTDIQPAK